MTERRRQKAANQFRELLDDEQLHARAIAEGKKLRSLAIWIVCGEYDIDRATLYRYCKRFKVSTR